MKFTRSDLIQFILEMTDTIESYPFNKVRPNQTVVWTIMKQVGSGKMMAMIFEKEHKLSLNLKLKPEHVEQMKQVEGITAGFHMNKKYWITIDINHADITQIELENMMHESDSLTKK
ncbi:MmcQ/YjbR family DNA-binding protein [Dellaglioa sp. BT-FLS60]